MQIKFNLHNGKKYDYYYIEKKSVIFTFKDGKFSYLIKVLNRKKLELICNCPGSKWRGKCQHQEFSYCAFDFKSKKEAKTFTDKVNEEFFTLWLDNRYQ